MSSNEIDPIRRPAPNAITTAMSFGLGGRHVRDQRADEERGRADRTPEERFEHGA